MTRRLATGRVFICVVAVSAALLGLAAVHPAGATHIRGRELLPDLETREPTDLVIGTVDGQKVLRFSNTVGNNHTGVLEVFPVSGGDCDSDGDSSDNRSAYQRVYRDANRNGTFDRGIDPQSRTWFAGCMQFHLAHSHWHFDAFAEYQLHQLNKDGTRGPMVGSSRKTSFCIADFGGRLWPQLPGSPSQSFYTQCERTSTQGLSVGWSDTYQYFLEGQHVPLPSGARGAFCLVSIADPLDRLVETDNTDNAESLRLTVSMTGDMVIPQRGTNC